MNPDLAACLIAAIIVLAVGCVALSANAHRAPSAPQDMLLYDGADPDAAPLLAVTLRLRGRPHAVVQTAAGHASVILDLPGLAPGVPASADILYVATETMIAAEALNLASAQGVLRYQDRAIPVALTPQLRELVRLRVAQLRASEARGPQIANQDPTVCRACAFRAMCAIGRVNAPAPLG